MAGDDGDPVRDAAAGSHEDDGGIVGCRGAIELVRAPLRAFRVRQRERRDAHRRDRWTVRCTRLVVGYEGCSGCDGGLILGADYEAVVVQRLLTGNGARSLFTLGLRPAVGFGRTFGSGPDASAITAAVDAPFSVAVPVGRTARLVPFVSPGFGVGALRGGGDSDSGTRGSIAFGAGLVDLAPGLGLNLSWRKVFLENAPATIGVGLTVER